MHFILAAIPKAFSSLSNATSMSAGVPTSTVGNSITLEYLAIYQIAANTVILKKLHDKIGFVSIFRCNVVRCNTVNYVPSVSASEMDDDEKQLLAAEL